jgi:rubrerythrin
MRFENAREAIKHAKYFHRELGGIFKNMAGQEHSEKEKLLLEYISHQESALADSLTQFEENTPVGVLDTWIQYADDANILKPPSTDDINEVHSLEEILTLAMKMSNEFIALYQQVEAQLDEAKVKEIFHNLSDMQIQKQKRLSMNYDRLMDL